MHKKVIVLFFVSTVVILLYISKRLLNSNSNISGKYCVFDPLHHIALPFSNYLLEHDLKRHLIRFFCGFCIDCGIALLFYLFIFKGTIDYQFIIATIFYSFKMKAQSLNVFPHPENCILDSNFIPNITVSNRKSNDYYFSGHIGSTVFLFFVYLRNKPNTYIIAAIIIGNLYVFWSLIVIGSHYTNDILIGYIVGYISYYFGRKLRFLFYYINITIISKLLPGNKFPQENIQLMQK